MKTHLNSLSDVLFKEAENQLNLFELDSALLALKTLFKTVWLWLLKAFEKLILTRSESPDYLLTDNGKEFDKNLVMDKLDQYGVQHAPIPPNHAQVVPVERAKGTLKTLISMYVKAEQWEWDVHIHEFRYDLNLVMQSTIKVSPAFLHFRRHLRPVKSLRREVETQWRGL